MTIAPNTHVRIVHTLRDHFQTSTDHHIPLLFDFFSLIDEALRLGININHSPDTNKLTICPEQLKDICEAIHRPILDIGQLKDAVKTVSYPCYEKNIQNIKTKLWNDQFIDVWVFNLKSNELTPPLSPINNASLVDSETKQERAIEKLLNLKTRIRIWRDSLAAANRKKTVIYNVEELSTQLHSMQNQIHKIQKLLT